MDKPYALDVTVSDGKYRFIQKVAGDDVQVLRYGEPWIKSVVPAQGSNAILAALYELAALQELIKTQASQKEDNPICPVCDNEAYTPGNTCKCCGCTTPAKSTNDV